MATAAESALDPGLEVPPAEEPQALRRPTGWGRRSLDAVRNLFWVLRADPLTLAGFLIVLALFVLAAVVEAVPVVSGLALGHAVSVLPYDPDAISPNVLQAPNSAHWLGTDQAGRDILSRVLAAAPIDLAVGLSIAGFSVVFGGALGLVSGYWDRPGSWGGASSATILRVTDIFLAFPSLVLALAIAAALGKGGLQSTFAIMATWWPYYVRLTRGEVLSVKHQPFVLAAVAAGVTPRRILGRHVLRNLVDPIAVYFTMDVGTAIVTFSTISFIGLAFPTSIPEWGSMIEDYSPYLLVYPWTVLSVVGMVFVTVLGFSLLGDGLREVLDPRSRRTVVTAGAMHPQLGVRAVVPSGEEAA
jgi:ABC-type dipeptide/oligopeptide/nickel transport system permease subunit